MDELNNSNKSLTQKEIEEELLKIGGKVETYTVQKPDIIYTNKKGEEIAIEVETGMGFRKHKKRLINKFKELKEYSGKVVVVLTNSDFKERYLTLLGEDFELYLRKDISDLLSSLNNKK